MSSTGRSYYCCFQFHSHSMDALFTISSKMHPLKSPWESLVFTYEQTNTACGCAEMLERMNGMHIGPSLKRNKEYDAVPYFLKSWNSASLQRRDGLWDMSGPDLHSRLHTEIYHQYTQHTNYFWHKRRNTHCNMYKHILWEVEIILRPVFMLLWHLLAGTT